MRNETFTWKSNAITLVLYFLFLPTLGFSAQSVLPERLSKDLEPLSGVIVMPAGSEFLIDLDASHGIIVGDLFSVLQPGEKVVHPITGEELGTLDEVRGILRITRVKDGFSHAEPLGEMENLSSGQAVRRYEAVPAVFVDETGKGRNVYEAARKTLPFLDWQGYHTDVGAAGKATLLFIFKDGELMVRGARSEELHRYSLSSSQYPSEPSPAGIVPWAAGVPGGIVKADPRIQEGVAVPLTAEGNSFGLEVADFDGDGQQEFALLYSDRLEIGRIQDGNAQILATLPARRTDKLLTVDSADLDGNGLAEIYVTAVSSREPSSLVFEFQEGTYQRIQTGIPFYIRAVNMPGEGHVLLGQRVGDLRTDFAPPLFRVERKGQRFQAGQEFPTPWGMDLFGFTPFTIDKDDLLFAGLFVNDRLKVKNLEGETLWESSRPFGGSKMKFERQDQTGANFALRKVAIKPRLEALEDGTLLVPTNEEGVLSGLGPSRVTAMKWNGNRLEALWHSRPSERYMPDFGWSDIDNDGEEELAMLIEDSSSGFLQKGRTSLVVLETP